MPHRRKLIVGNWKMHVPGSEAGALIRAIRAGEHIVVCPPFTALVAARDALKGSPIRLGAQDCHPEPKGAFTGDISAAMLKDAGCSHVIIGHSERRHHHQETDTLIRKKAEEAHAAGLVAILCIGETARQRKEGEARKVVEEQLLHSLPDHAYSANTVIAYEPVWAIGTGNTATTADITEMHDFINRLTKSHRPEWGGPCNALYGGSVKAENAKEILSIASVGGVLVGGASLKAEEFNAIAEAG